MPRNNPNEGSPNPAKRWFTWAGDKGNLKYYDKETQTEIEVDLPFEFILLDRLAVVRGWHDASESGITSNEVRRIQDEPFTVRAFKMKEPIASGFYSDIKDRVKSAGGKFNTNLYIAFTDDGGELEIGSLMLHGAAMSAWFDLENGKETRPLLYKRGIVIPDYKEGKKGSIKFRVPNFTLVQLPEDLDDKAGALQVELKSYLSKYLGARKPKDELDQRTATDEASEDQRPQLDEDGEEIPF
jgi:hypothetical protein